MTRVIQSVRFLRGMWSKEQAMIWLRDHGFNPVALSPNPQYKSYISFRQVQPEKLSDYRTVKNEKFGILFIIGTA